MIIGINAVTQPIHYGVYADDGASEWSLSVGRDIEGFPKRVLDDVQGMLARQTSSVNHASKVGADDVSRARVSQIVTILGPGNYTGIRLSLTVAKMMGMVYECPVVGVSLFEAYMMTHARHELTLLTSESRKGWVNAQLFQANGESFAAISSINQVKESQLQPWLATFNSPIFWGHFGDIAGDYSMAPRRARVHMTMLLAAIRDDKVTMGAHPLVPLYSYPAVLCNP